MLKHNMSGIDRKYHIVYKTTCIVTNNFYVGLHSTDDINDKYLGSDIRLKRSVSKYGVVNHIREVLFVAASRQEAAEYEAQILTEDFRNDPKCLNCGPGGLGVALREYGVTEEARRKMSEASKNAIRTKEWYEKVVATRRARSGYSKSEEERQKIREALTGKTLTEEHKRNISAGGVGKKRSDETCARISEALKGKNKVKKPFTESHKEAIRQSRLGKKHSEAAKLNMRLAKQKCTNQI